MARPSLKSKELCDQICALLTEGESLRAVCKREGMPSRSAVLDWLAADPEFSSQYARAKEIGLEEMAEEILEIADDGTHDTIETKFGEIPNKEWILRSKLRVDSRKWILSKLLPKKYGDKVGVEHSAGDGLAEVLRIVRGGEDGDE